MAPLWTGWGTCSPLGIDWGVQLPSCYSQTLRRATEDPGHLQTPTYVYHSSFHLLSNWQLFISLSGHTSTHTTVTQGVPQGSVLGPICFICDLFLLSRVIHNLKLDFHLNIAPASPLRALHLLPLSRLTSKSAETSGHPPVSPSSYHHHHRNHQVETGCDSPILSVFKSHLKTSSTLSLSLCLLFYFLTDCFPVPS